MIADWRKSWRWWSMQAMAVATAMQGAWLALPDDLKAFVPSEIVSGITMTLLILGMIGRLISQGKTDA